MSADYTAGLLSSLPARTDAWLPSMTSKPEELTDQPEMNQQINAVGSGSEA